MPTGLRQFVAPWDPYLVQGIIKYGLYVTPTYRGPDVVMCPALSSLLLFVLSVELQSCCPRAGCSALPANGYVVKGSRAHPGSARRATFLAVTAERVALHCRTTAPQAVTGFTLWGKALLFPILLVIPVSHLQFPSGAGRAIGRWPRLERLAVAFPSAGPCCCCFRSSPSGFLVSLSLSLTIIGTDSPPFDRPTDRGTGGGELARP